MKIKLLSVGSASGDNGYGRVLSELYPFLLDPFEIHHLGIDYQGPVIERGGIVLHPNSSQVDAIGTEPFAALAEALRPDVIFILQDPVIAEGYLVRVAEREVSSRIVVYASLDAHVTQPDWAMTMERADTLVFYTELARREYARAVERAGPGAADGPSAIHVVPNGVSSDRFFPVDRAFARKTLLGTRDPSPDAFIVLNANQNHPRKNLPLTFAGFAAFARDKPANVLLWLHMARKRFGQDIVSLAYEHGIRDRLILTSDTVDRDPEAYKVSVEQLNLIYNACDIGINTSYGEGWGLVSFEHAAARRPQIVPGYLSTEEIWQGAAELLPPEEVLEDPFSPYRFEASAPHHVAAALERLYSDSDHRERLASAAYDRVTDPRFSWKTLAESWREVLLAARPGAGRVVGMGAGGGANEAALLS